MTIQRRRQHWSYQKQNEDKQNKKHIKLKGRASRTPRKIGYTKGSGWLTCINIRIQGGRTRRAPPPLKLEKIWFFTRNTQTIFAPPSAIGKNMIFCRKIVIFHTKYPKIFRTSLRSAQSFKICPLLPLPPNLKSWIRPWTIYVFAEKQTRNAHQRLSSVV